MAREPIEAAGGPPAPKLVSPREETLVDGRAVVFVWEPVDEATQYRLEVARDPAFAACVFEETFERRTSLAVSNFFESDGQTYFWRVLAGNDAGWSAGDHVESFVATDRETAARFKANPDLTETYGPAARLFTASGLAVAQEATGSEEAEAAQHAMGVEHDRIEAGQIASLALGILVALVVAIVFVVQWTSIRAQEARQGTVGRSGYPELRNLTVEATRHLTQYEAIDAGTYRIPIDRAMELMLAESYRKGNPPSSPELPRPAPY